jgi:S-adenosylmethionine uptake transporter
MSATAHANPRRQAAIGYTLAGVAVLCAMDGVIKHLVADNDSLAVTLGRYVFGVLFAAAIWIHAGRPALTAEIWRAHAGRGLLLAVMSSCFFYSLSVLSLAEAIALFFIAPLLIPFFARLVLGERIQARSVLACLLGLAGMLVATLGEPAGQAHSQRLLGILAVLTSALAYALSMTLLRSRAGRDGPAVVGLMATLMPGLVLVGPTLALADLPTASALPFLVLMGALGAAGLYLLTLGYARAEAQVLAPLEYTGLIWAALIGYFFFNEVPRPQVWLGAAVIVGACLWSSRPPPDAQARSGEVETGSPPGPRDTKNPIRTGSQA